MVRGKKKDNDEKNSTINIPMEVITKSYINTSKSTLLLYHYTSKKAIRDSIGLDVLMLEEERNGKPKATVKKRSFRNNMVRREDWGLRKIRVYLILRNGKLFL